MHFRNDFNLKKILFYVENFSYLGRTRFIKLSSELFYVAEVKRVEVNSGSNKRTECRWKQGPTQNVGNSCGWWVVCQLQQRVVWNLLWTRCLHHQTTLKTPLSRSYKAYWRAKKSIIKKIIDGWRLDRKSAKRWEDAINPDGEMLLGVRNSRTQPLFGDSWN